MTTGSPGELLRLAARLRRLAEDMDGCAQHLGAEAAPADLRRRLRRHLRSALAGADRLRHASAATEAYAHRLAAVLDHRAELAEAARRRRWAAHRRMAVAVPAGAVAR
ncbi:hypothetical protein [Peterkaempfera bronchialis]|uniref:Uncharacterized protein n=1 Tax=Peterkaempfera bronchialis TaxID=2126346 RepID=A0A345SXF8_9ACTN|nr:hypothetical protein [Peterkaempfera bronchialis]AXI78413.1 hypothetical protein C7M71_014205 [Peterkaempfera bronchialis]